jgi:cobalamin biosynthesis protein CobT
MMQEGTGPSASTVGEATEDAAGKAMGGVDDWEKDGENSAASTRVTHSGDKDEDDAKAAASDDKDELDGRNPAAAGSTDPMGARTEGLQSNFEWNGADLTVKPNHDSEEVMLVPRISADGVSDSIDIYKDLVRKHAEYIRSTMRYISAILDDETGMFIKDHQKRGKIDPSRIHQYWRTDEVFRVFEHVAGDRNYAIVLVVDGSGSMSGTPIKQATAGAVIIAEALDDLEIPFSVMVYNTGYVSRLDEDHMDVYEVTSDPKRPYVCTPAPPGTFSGGAIVNTLYKPLDESRMTVSDKCKLGYMIARGAGGCNDDAYAIRFAANMLHKYHDRENKIMIVLADGYPAGHSGGMWINDVHYNQDDALKQMVKIAMDTEINVIGLGIEGCDLADYYPQSQTIKNLSDIPKVLGELLKESIRTGRRQ